MAQADTSVLGTTYAIQLEGRHGDWNWHDGTEYTSEGDVHTLGRSMYGGEVPYRVVTITRSVGEKQGGGR